MTVDGSHWDRTDIVMPCGSCGRYNPSDATFCQWCNHFLAWTTSDEGDVDIAGPSETAEVTSQELPPEPATPHESETAASGDDTAGDDTAGDDTAQQAPPDAPPRPDEPAELAPPPTVARAMAVLAEGRRLATDQDRPDLDRRLHDAEARLAAQSVPVVVAGEFKRGKSSLVNALLQSSVCPVDADIVTTVPTLVRWGATPVALVRADDAETGGTQEVVDPARLSELVTGHDTGPERAQVHTVEVALPHPLLQSGLCLVDTPGVGGLHSAHGLLTLGALDAAKGALFVTDASQELTAPELAFLQAVVAKDVGPVCVVLTKTDIHPDWRRIRDLDLGHLQDAGLSVPLFAVSSFLRMQAARDPELQEESGFEDLLHFLERDVLERGTAQAAKTAAQDAAFVAHQLARPLEAVAAVITEPERADEVVATLTETRQRTAKLTGTAATWQLTLRRGLDRLTADVTYDLNQRIRAILTQVETVIKQGDPKDTWTDITQWLQRQVVTAAVENRALLTSGAQQLAQEVGDRFELEAAFDAGAAAGAPRPEVVAGVTVTAADHLVVPGGQLGALVVAGRTAMLVPLTLYGLASLFPVAPLVLMLMAPISVALGAGVGHRLITNERQRQLVHRQQLAAAAARKYLDEALFVISKESQDALMVTSHDLWDGFQQQAEEIHRSSVRALSIVEQARSAPPDRAEAVLAGSRAVRRLSVQAGRLADTPVVAVARG